MSRERPVARQSIFNQFAMPDEHSFGVFKMLADVYPAFSKKIFEGNELMQKLVVSGYNPMDIMDYPVCGKCETLAPYSGVVVKNGKRVQKCTCVKHGCAATTVNPVTFRNWIKDELKRKAPADFMDALDYAVDKVAKRMLDKYILEMRSAAFAFRQIASKKMGVSEETMNDIVDPATRPDKPKIEHLGSTSNPNLPKDRIEITESIEDENDEE